MKKIIYFICIMLFGFSIKADPVVKYQEGIYSNRIGDKLYSGQLGYIFIDDEIVYCLDPYKIISIGYNEDTNYLNNMDKENLKYFELVSYYGYNKTNRNNIYYYMAAQELIWERVIGSGNIFWTTGINNTGSRIDISKYKKEIIKDINNFNTSPSFENETKKYDYFVNTIFTDENKVLNNYEYIIEGNSIVTKGNNTISVKMLDHKKTKINLTRRIKTNNKTIIYTKSGNQTLGRFGIDLVKKSQFYVEPNEYKSNVLITFYDKETNEILRDVEFKLCPSNELLNINGKYSGKFSEGKYIICELEKYEITDDLFFEIKKEELQEYIKINFYLTELKKLIIITKKEVSKIIEIPEIKKEIPIVQSKNTLEELPNTCDYQSIKYSIIFIVMLGSVLYKNKN